MTEDETIAPLREQPAPIGDVLRELAIHPLPEGWRAVEGVVLVKCHDAEGDAVWAFRTTSGLNDEELLGVMTIRTDLLRKELLESFSREEDADDD